MRSNALLPNHVASAWTVGVTTKVGQRDARWARSIVRDTSSARAVRKTDDEKSAVGEIRMGKFTDGVIEPTVASELAPILSACSRFETARLANPLGDLVIWASAPKTLRSLLEDTASWPERVLFASSGQSWTYREHLIAVARFAHALRNRFGVVKGDRVAIAMQNRAEWSIAFWATQSIGAIAVPINAWLLGPEMTVCIDDSGACVLVADTVRLDRLGDLDALPSVDHVIAVDLAAFDRTTMWTAALENQPDTLPDAIVEPDDPATIFYTSGTTGRPKGALGTHRAACQNIVSVSLIDAFAYHRRHGDLSGFAPGAPGIVALLAIPLFHVGGCHGTLIPMIARGATIVIQERWDAAVATTLMREYDITHFTGVPTQFVQLADLLEQADEVDVPAKVKMLNMGGSAPPPELPGRLARLFPYALLASGFGQTECTQIATLTFGTDFEAKARSCGRPIPIVAMQLLIDGKLVPMPDAVGQTGEMVLRAPTMLREYFNRPEATSETIVNGWMRTGDIASVDADGMLTIVDRAKDMIIRGGENIYCIEVERVLLEHPLVAEVAVYGRSHRVLGEEPVATVVLTEGSEVQSGELREFAAGKLAAFKVPVEIFISPTSLERNPIGKVLKSVLRTALAQPT